MSTNSQFSQLTIDVTNSLTKDEKKKCGIFITPRIIIEKIVSSINEYTLDNNIEIKKILEPSCGTCEIVSYFDNLFDNNVVFDAIEYNDTIYNSIKGLNFKNEVNIIHNDFIKFQNSKEYDLIITNPPYFVCKKDEIPNAYREFASGRPNIFGLFIIHSLSMIKQGGILAFIVPKSFLNSIYYSKVRNYIKETCKIIEIMDFEKDNFFIDTDQPTFGIILQKNIDKCKNLENSGECQYSMKIDDNYIFSSDTLILKNIFQGSTTLKKMGLKVKTGSIVWNEHKQELTSDKKETLLIYNTNITKDNKLEIKDFKNNEKHQYIKKEGNTDSIIVVNRGNGNSKYKLNYAIIRPDNGPYLVENHLNEIYSPDPMKGDELNALYGKIIKSFKNPKTQLFIQFFLGNNGLSKTELETIFPIYLE